MFQKFAEDLRVSIEKGEKIAFWKGEFEVVVWNGVEIWGLECRDFSFRGRRSSGDDVRIFNGDCGDSRGRTWRNFNG